MQFLRWVREKYETTEEQQDLQKRDFQAGGAAKMKSGKRSRWCRELQRRCGTKQMWEAVSFNGGINVEALQRA